MTYEAVYYDDTAVSTRDDQLDDIATVWAALGVMADLPATAEQKATLADAQRNLSARIADAGITERELRDRPADPPRQQPRLRLVPDD